jgi:hypothetical protein
MRRIAFMLFGLLMFVMLGLPQPAQAQNARRCFEDVPGITNCIEGRFREYWEQNGGLPVFGYPITAAVVERTAEGEFLTQYFERNRFELHPQKSRPYDVLLGRLGDDRLQQQGRDWRGFAGTTAEPGCLYFSETRQNVCDLEAGLGFKTYWESHGLQDPALNRFQRSLALFGLPLSGITAETNVAGDTVLTQWFERARFEYHLNQPRAFRVLLGLLGNETRAPQPAPPAPPRPNPPPSTACDGVPAAQNAIPAPACVKAGVVLTVAVYGFEPNQQIRWSLLDDANATVGTPQTLQAGVNGLATIDIDTKEFAGAALRPGNYTLVAESTRDPRREARAPFRIIP